MESDYFVVNFRTPSGIKKIRIKKSPPPMPIGSSQGIRTGALLPGQGMPYPMGYNPQYPSFPYSPSSYGRNETQASNQGAGISETTLNVQGTFTKAGRRDRIDIKADGIEVPEVITSVTLPEEIDEETVKTLDIKYPLIPKNPKQGEPVLAYAHIFYSSKINEPVYLVAEPKIDEKDKKTLDDMKEYIQEKLDINFSQLTKSDAVKYIIKLVERAFDYFKVMDRGSKRNVYRYYILRDFIGLGKIEAFVQDKEIEDISCDGLNIPIYVYHRNPKLGSIRTNVMFTTTEELDSFVNKLSERCGKTISVAKPLLDGSLPDGSRIQATLGSDIARHGSNFTIRMFTEKPLTPVDMIKYGTCDLKMMAYYWFLVENGFSMIIAGGTASGKTSFLNVLSLFIKPQMKIVSIEDTAELRIPHAHWVPEVARTSISEEGKVDLFELLRESLRQRPDYIIVGEVRGKEAYVLFQQMATGHPGISTIHADSFPKLMDRLVTPPISLPPGLIQNLDLIIFLKRVKRGRKYIRKVFESDEVMGFDIKENAPLVNEIFSWDPFSNKFLISNKSGLLKKISNNTGMTSAEIQDGLRKRASVLEWLVNNNVTDFKKVASVINLFYMSPDFLLERIGST
jgi:archaeal flagellar protein FlaI